MPNEAKITIDDRCKYLLLKQKLYVRAKRKERSQMLGQMEQATGLDRKTLIRHMNGKMEHKPRCEQLGSSVNVISSHGFTATKVQLVKNDPGPETQYRGRSGLYPLQ